MMTIHAGGKRALSLKKEDQAKGMLKTQGGWKEGDADAPVLRGYIGAVSG